jgi:hypothetical protein
MIARHTFRLIRGTALPASNIADQRLERILK